MSDLLYTVGLDATDLDTAATAVERRLEQSGVRIAEQPSKYAKASASAFEEVYAAEDKLAQFRSKVAFERMTDEEKLAVLRQQATGMMERLAGMEDRTAEKASLQLDYEKKKSEIYTVNQRLMQSASTESAAHTAEIAKQPGILGRVNQAASEIKKGFAAVGMEIRGIGIGVLIAQVGNLAKQAIAEAQKTRDEFEKMGKPISGSIRSMAALGDAMKEVKGFAVDAVGFLVGGYTQLGDVIGSAINRLRGISAEQERIAELTQREADAQDARLAKLQAEQHDVESIRRAREDLAELEKRTAFERLSADEQMNALLMEGVRLREQIANTEEGTVAYYERKKQLLENTNQIYELGLKLTEAEAEAEDRIVEALADFFGPLDTIEEKKAEIVAVTHQQADAEAAVTAELERQRDAAEQARAAKEAASRAAFGGTVTGAPQYEGMSSAMLRGLMADLREQIAEEERNRINRMSFENPSGSSFSQLYKQDQLAAIEAELTLRSRVQRTADRKGEEAARAHYGDAITDRGLRDLQSVQERQAVDIQDIADRLRNLFPKG
jgi:hypothetical protein